MSLWLTLDPCPHMRPLPDVSRQPGGPDGLTTVGARESDNYYSPWPRCLWWVSPASPTRSSGSVRTSLRRTLPRRAAAAIPPLSASPRARVLCAGGTCVGSMTPGTARPRPNTPGRRWTLARTFRLPDVVCPSGRSSVPAAHDVEGKGWRVISVG